MQGHKVIIEHLNSLLSHELGAINQHFLHARLFANWGLDVLNKKHYHKSIEDMKQADKLIERILFLQGLPNLQHIERLHIGENTAEILCCDEQQLGCELDVLRQTVVLCENNQDYVSRDILTDIIAEEEEFLDWVEAQQYLVANTGIENYQQSMMIGE